MSARYIEELNPVSGVVHIMDRMPAVRVGSPGPGRRVVSRSQAAWYCNWDRWHRRFGRTCQARRLSLCGTFAVPGPLGTPVLQGPGRPCLLCAPLRREGELDVPPPIIKEGPPTFPTLP